MQSLREKLFGKVTSFAERLGEKLEKPMRMAASIPDAVREVYGKGPGAEEVEAAPVVEEPAVEPATPVVEEPVIDERRETIRKGIQYAETRGSEDPYTAVGPTNDLGKYQVSPDSLKAWSGAWLGKTYTEEEFLADPDAQEKFFEEYLNVVDRLNLTPEEAAVTWHRGWGQLGTGSKETRDKRFRETLDKLMQEEQSQKYLEAFKTGTSTS